jgi:septum formation protein
MLSHLKNFNIILASQSPRRKELLAGLNLPFTIKALDIDESYPDEYEKELVPEFLAKKKAEAYSEYMNEKTLVIAADTIVLNQGKIYNKPKNREEAYNMLKSISGMTHQVITGVCIKSKIKQISFSDTTLVEFRVLDNAEINYYLDNYAPYDKAGAYGVQEWIGYTGVKSMNGSYFNVMGLPVEKLYLELKKWNIYD